MSSTQSQVTCPKCGDVISITQALGAEIEQKFEREFRARMLAAQQELERKVLATRQEIEARAKQERAEFELRSRQERAELEKKLREDIAARSQVEFADLKAQVEEKNQRLFEAQTKELEFRKKQRELEEREKNAELEVQRKLDEEKALLLRKHEEERARLTGEAVARAAEEYRQKVAEKDHQLDGMRKQIEDLKRKSEQGSQQIQGEVLELELETLLKQTFPLDQIEPVAKGQRGGDIVQRVISPSGQVAGTILWETKRTKNWSDGWVDKLKEDQREITAECAVIVSTVMPKAVTRLGQVDGVWVCELQAVVGLATVLRHSLAQVHLARVAAVGKGESADKIYQYVTGTQFRQRMEAVIENFQTMQVDLLKERAAAEKNWAKREKQLALISCQTVSMVGDIQGLVGSSMPKIAALEHDDEDEFEGEKEIPNYASSSLQGFTQS